MITKFVSASQTEPAFLIPMDERKQPKILAELFCALDNKGQARFFDRIAEIDIEHWKGRGVFQWRAVQTFLTPQAKQVINDIKENTDE